ncbi:hypothetical protein GCM10011360_31680 [Primorskyibacter flagellatus]|uniref:Lipoprotein n=1 Tax=Primorskyibacter flagellatus TaxID=1387277 RepID=A0A917AE30_9RHOB|nr:hypothetical protein [Primorskyibacter flagellatus]GGE41851.1 hypothetical protein GCM10011360_31680 [Primorskyibacter flagellatus]
MRIPVLFTACLLLAACDAPTRGFGGAEVSRHVVEGSSFTVHLKGDQAQAVRTNRQYAPRVGPLAGRAAMAMQQASGCRVRRIAGDAAVLVGALSCSAAAHPACEVDAVLVGRRGLRVPVRRTCP